MISNVYRLFFVFVYVVNLVYYLEPRIPSKRNSSFNFKSIVL